MSASIAKNIPSEPDPRLDSGSGPHEHGSKISTLRKRTILAALAVVIAGGVLAAPVGAIEDTSVMAAIMGDVEPVTLDTTLAPQEWPLVVAHRARFDRVGQVTAATTDPVTIESTVRAATTSATVNVTDSVWDRLADCESGDWDRNGNPIPGSARWDYGLTFSHGDIFEGGPNFHPRTWESFKDADMPGHAGQATREQQILVAERVLAAQGWGAWPVCTRKLGLR